MKTTMYYSIEKMIYISKRSVYVKI